MAWTSKNSLAESSEVQEQTDKDCSASSDQVLYSSFHSDKADFIRICAEKLAICPFAIPVSVNVSGDRVDIASNNYMQCSLAKTRAAENFPTERVISWIDQLLSSLEFAHENGFVHGNLTPASVFIFQKGAHLGDFYFFVGDSSGTRTTMAYEPPEMQKHGEYTAKSDIYALGRVILFAITGRDPTRMNQYEIHSEGLFTLMKMMLATKPADRASIPELREALKRISPGENLATYLPCCHFPRNVTRIFDESLLPQLIAEVSLRKSCKSCEIFCYERLLSAAEAYMRGEKCEEKLPIEEIDRMKRVEDQAMKSALDYQKFGLYELAIQSYCKSMLALKLLKRHAGDFKTTKELRRKIRACYYNCEDLKRRTKKQL